MCEIHGPRASGLHKTLRLRRRVLWWPEARGPCTSPSGFVVTGGPRAMYFTHHGKPWLKPITRHYLSQSWPRSMLPYGATGHQWVNQHPHHITANKGSIFDIWVQEVGSPCVSLFSVGPSPQTYNAPCSWWGPCVCVMTRKLIWPDNSTEDRPVINHTQEWPPGTLRWPQMTSGTPLLIMPLTSPLRQLPSMALCTSL